MGFYKIPIVVVFLVALLVAFLQNRKLKFDEKIVAVAHSVGDKDIVTMILIFLVAGIFVGVVGRSSAESVAYFLLSLIPAQYAVADIAQQNIYANVTTFCNISCSHSEVINIITSLKC